MTAERQETFPEAPHSDEQGKSQALHKPQSGFVEGPKLRPIATTSLGGTVWQWGERVNPPTPKHSTQRQRK